jgi:dTDP-4-dehydrorhamnose 3,5-epimerase
MPTDILNSFKKDPPWAGVEESALAPIPTTTVGVTVTPLTGHADHRGHLTELMTLRDNDHILPIVHVYQVHCTPGSIRGWVYHERQMDRLAFTQGDFSLVLYDLRKESPTYGGVERLDVGLNNPCRVAIPAFVAHLLRNSGEETSSFVNMPTQFYDPANPDKCRLPYPDSLIPFTFDD